MWSEWKWVRKTALTCAGGSCISESRRVEPGPVDHEQLAPGHHGDAGAGAGRVRHRRTRAAEPDVEAVRQVGQRVARHRPLVGMPHQRDGDRAAHHPGPRRGAGHDRHDADCHTHPTLHFKGPAGLTYL